MIDHMTLADLRYVSESTFLFTELQQYTIEVPVPPPNLVQSLPRYDFGGHLLVVASLLLPFLLVLGWRLILRVRAHRCLSSPYSSDM